MDISCSTRRTCGPIPPWNGPLIRSIVLARNLWCSSRDGSPLRRIRHDRSPWPPPPSSLAHPADVRPMWSLWLLSIAHAVNHAQAVVLPLIYLKITDDFHVGVDTIAFLAAGGAFASGIVQLSFASLTRLVSRRRLLGAGGLLFGGGFVAQAFATGFPTFALANVLSRIGGSPQHPVGNGLLAEQFPARAAGLRHQRPHRRRQRGHGRGRAARRADHPGLRLARRGDRLRHPGHRHRHRHPAAGPRTGHRPRGGRWPAGACATPSGGSSATATCAGST